MWEPAWKYGGPIRSTYQLCAGIQSLGADVKVITTNFGLEPTFDLKDGVEVTQSGLQVTYFRTWSNHLSYVFSPSLLRAFPDFLAWADIFHISAIWHPIGLYLQRQAISHGTPFVHSVRGALSDYSFSQKSLKKIPYYFLLERQLLLQASALHLTSNAELKESLRPFLRLPSAIPRLVIPNISYTQPPSVANEEKDKFLLKFNISPDIPTFLICGRIDHKKGLDLIPKALEAIADRSWNLLVVGPDYDSTLHSLMSSLAKFQYHNHIQYLGLMEPHQLPIIFSISHLLLMPSLHENFGNVALEALMQGCQVLLSTATGISGYLENLTQTNSWGASLPRDHDLWGAWLQQWLDNPHRRERFIFHSELGNFFSGQQISRQWLSSYSGIIS